jgi:SSS family solute:Na+ symporter
VDILILGACLAAVLGLGLRAARRRRRGLADYVLASRTLTLPLFVATLVPTFYGGVLGIGEFTWREGVANWLVMAAPYYFFAGVYAFFLAGKVRLEPGLTIPDHIEGAYGKPLAITAALLVFVLACPADELLMVGTLLSHFSSVKLSWAMAAAGIMAWALVLRGGLRSDVWANSLQFVLMFAGFALILPFAAKAMPLAKLLRNLPPGHLSPTGGLGALQILSWWLIAVWTLVDPSFHQRCAAAENPRTARRGILVSIAFWALFDLMTTSAGLYARALAPDLREPLLAFPVLADRLLPPLLRGLFYAGLSSSILASLQGRGIQSCVRLGKEAL